MVNKTYRELIKQHTFMDNLSIGSEDIKGSEDDVACPRDGVILFDKAAVKKAFDKEFRADRKTVLKELYEECNIRSYATINKNIFTDLDRLARQFGNFTEVIRLCQTRLTLFKLASPQVISLPPILLVGPPGVGKTRFLKEMAKVLRTDFFSLDFSTMSSGFILAGGASSWSDSKPGFISESLRESEFANPIILLDEIDKSNTSLRFDPLGCLYSLLETHSAKNFRDEFLEVEMDMSHIIWFATANNPNTIPAPIRSRMTEINIELPTHEQAKTIVKSIYSETLASYPWGTKFTDKLDIEVVEELATNPPRQVRKQLELALANAASRAGRKRKQIKLETADLDNQVGVEKKQKSGIGFLATF